MPAPVHGMSPGDEPRAWPWAVPGRSVRCPAAPGDRGQSAKAVSNPLLRCAAGVVACLVG